MINIMKLCLHVAVLFLFYYIGMWIQTTWELFIPGSVIGLLLLFLCLIFKIIKLEWVELGAAFMMKHLVVFFIPSTVSLIGYYTLFAGKGILLIVITVISTIIVMLTSAFVSERFVGGKTNG